MEALTGIVFEDVEPPNPYLKTPWIPISPVAKRVPYSFTAFVNRMRDLIPGYKPKYARPRLLQERQALLPASSTSVVVHIVQDIARTTIVQAFNNDSQATIRDGKYQFPVPYGSNIVDFKCKIGNREIQGQVKPRDTAQEEFDNARNRGQTAGLVKQDTPEIFTTELGNIPDKTTVNAELSLIFFLKHNLAQRSSIATLTIPRYIAPRYGRPDCKVDQNGPPLGKLSISVEILNADKIDWIESYTHDIIVKRRVKEKAFQSWADFVADSPSHRSPSVANVRLPSGHTSLKWDFVLRISTISSAKLFKPRASLEIHPLIEGHSATMIEIPAEFMLQRQASVNNKEIIFLVDRSGSMSSKIPGLISAMQIYLRSLPLSIPFNICSFGSTFELLWKESKAYSDTTLDEALTHVSKFSASLGGTDLLPALERAVMQQQQSFLDVIVLTDGEVWRLEETLRFVKLTHTVSKKAVRFFSLGIGHAVSHELVEGIAKFGGGYAEIIPPAKTTGWEDRLVAVLRASLTGHATSMSIEVEGLDIHNEHNEAAISAPTIQMSPGDMSTLSPFGRNRIFILAQNGQINSNSIIKIKSSQDGKVSSTTIPVMALQEKDSLLHKFAARALLSDLERASSWIQRDHRIREGADTASWTKIEGERLGCQWSLVSKWTSFVAVEAIRTYDREKPSPEIINVPRYETVDGDDWGLLHPVVARRAPIPVVEGIKKESKRNFKTTQVPVSDGPILRSLGPCEPIYHGSQPRTSESYSSCSSSELSHFYAAPSTSELTRDGHIRDSGFTADDLLFDNNASVVRRGGDTSDTFDPRNLTTHLSSTTPPEEFVWHIVSYQRADGCFLLRRRGIGKMKLGSEIMTIAEGLFSDAISLEIAITIVIVALLEERFPNLRDMWLLIVQKAREYIGIPELDEHPSMLAAKSGVNSIAESAFQEGIHRNIAN
ncbi:von Willebrand domain-containing protein [Nannizzia gypsea CBS 118893]|uniref:von Willebrand domain-containing protein n=1 Tax=Arthroderma gypseum (strain ATCC MYA-4604 / CBS 118893) TaxID=535722 RepID=E4UT81_ARTGP|nr:von Willebrand domain-containing protein [Nannizzia gypsea CBS 118893]EFR01477.1 von Willebrand domain-containing protein [Nannizzia gypsea CBS 118893]